jgi:NifB/MoaA-like Fe-S oxidoreductase
MAASFALGFLGGTGPQTAGRSGFFQWVEGAPADGYRAPTGVAETRRSLARHGGPLSILTGEYGACVLAPLLESAGMNHVALLPVKNAFFGGNIAVTGLLTGEDVASALRSQPEDARFLLPDVCLSRGRFLDGVEVSDLPRSVEVVPADGASLRQALTEAQ